MTKLTNHGPGVSGLCQVANDKLFRGAGSPVAGPEMTKSHPGLEQDTGGPSFHSQRCVAQKVEGAFR